MVVVEVWVKSSHFHRPQPTLPHKQVILGWFVSIFKINADKAEADNNILTLPHDAVFGH